MGQCYYCRKNSFIEMPRNTLSDAQIQANRANAAERAGNFLKGIAPYLMAVPGVSPAAQVGTALSYGPGMLEAAKEAQKRGSKIPGLPELGITEAIGSFGAQQSEAFNRAMTPSAPEQEPEPEPVIDRKELERQSMRADYDKIRADKDLTTKEKEAKGLEMWRQANPELAKNLDAKRYGDRVIQEDGMRTPGYNPLMQSTFGYQAEPEIRQPLEGQEIIEAVNANKAAEMAERFTAPEGADEPAFVVDAAATTYPDAKKKLLNRATLKQLQNQDFRADAPVIIQR
jgi:hypothetical protein